MQNCTQDLVVDVQRLICLVDKTIVWSLGGAALVCSEKTLQMPNPTVLILDHIDRCLT